LIMIADTVPSAAPTAGAGRGLSRRAVLTAGAAAGGGLLIGFRLLPATNAVAAPEAEALAPNAFVRIEKNGRVTVISPSIEMGQGTYTSLSMLIAEELEVDLAQVNVEHAPANDKLYANPALGFQVTGGSTSIRGFWKPLRAAGAAARSMLFPRRRRCGKSNLRRAAPQRGKSFTSRPGASCPTAPWPHLRRRSPCLSMSPSRIPRTSA
jgi:hypothetical protein